MTIANRLDQAMNDAGIPSQSALARASGVPQPTINRILKGTGKKGPETATLVKLAIACNVSFDWLHEGVGEKTRITRANRPEPDFPKSMQWVNAQETRLLSLFRTTDDRGRDEIVQAALAAPRDQLRGIINDKT